MTSIYKKDLKLSKIEGELKNIFYNISTLNQTSFPLTLHKSKVTMLKIILKKYKKISLWEKEFNIFMTNLSMYFSLLVRMHHFDHSIIGKIN